ncbi:DUF6252 family protein [Paraflavitalea speifideaquila]|uniref:DUF6252 family protein n=1 Tax=Paraflavitalea speifideaquila TaxID=3076558 RepID=UPI0028E46158|nr:DUF6252 family protein [Paraflavitalea speifideiaquila]
MKIDSKQWIADKVAGASIFAGYIVITGVSNDKKSILIQLEDKGVATYQLNQQSLYGAALTDENEINQNSYTTNQGKDLNDAGGTVVVTKIDKTNKTISGTFSFKMFREMDDKQVVITEGVFEDLQYTTELPPTTGADADFKVKINGTAWTGKNVSGVVLMGKLMINATELDVSQTVGLSLPSDIAVGTHDFVQFGDVVGLYIKGGVTMSATSGKLIISEHNTTSKVIKGTFNFEAKEFVGSGSAQLTEGSFSVKYQ